MTDLGSFEWVAPHSAKMRCTKCGRTGYPGGRWQAKCMEPHLPCPKGCGRSFPAGSASATHQRSCKGRLCTSVLERKDGSRLSCVKHQHDPEEQHWAVDGDGRDVVWLDVVLPPWQLQREVPVNPA